MTGTRKAMLWLGPDSTSLNSLSPRTVAVTMPRCYYHRVHQFILLSNSTSPRAQHGVGGTRHANIVQATQSLPLVTLPTTSGMSAPGRPAIHTPGATRSTAVGSWQTRTTSPPNPSIPFAAHKTHSQASNHRRVSPKKLMYIE